MSYVSAKRTIICFIVLLIASVFTGCAKGHLIYEKRANYTDIVEDSAYGKIKMNFDKLDGEDIRSFQTQKGKMYEFTYDYNISYGDIKIIITDSKENILAQTKWNNELERDIKKNKGETAKVNGSGGVLKITSTDDKIRIVIAAKEASGSLSIKW